ncbi:hypothetical protein AMK33_38785 [Streptomyces sp. CB02400]|nr:hypothetical protein AMK33_38785 [Streptomyces sp. CB02400]
MCSAAVEGDAVGWNGPLAVVAHVRLRVLPVQLPGMHGAEGAQAAQQADQSVCGFAPDAHRQRSVNDDDDFEPAFRPWGEERYQWPSAGIVLHGGVDIEAHSAAAAPCPSQRLDRASDGQCAGQRSGPSQGQWNAADAGCSPRVERGYVSVFGTVCGAGQR